ncbi:MAG: family 78 glycoside hydrolase catalytic domain [Verrucomicrobiota bacterium]
MRKPLLTKPNKTDRSASKPNSVPRQNRLSGGLVLCVLLVATSTGLAANGNLKVSDLRCEYLTNPLAIDAARPRLSWTLSSPMRGARQSAYQILVASSPQNLAAEKTDLWDSGKVSSDETIQTEYAGKPLASGADCFWKVRAWDSSDSPSAWSEPARWTLGLLKPEDWQASWIRADFTNSISPWLRKTFVLDSAPSHAVAYVNAIGYFELYVNGCKVGTDVLAPAVSDTRIHSLYVAYDISSYLQAGTNCIGLWCGRGWATKAESPSQRVRFQCRIATDASKDAVAILSDESWKVAPSPYTTLGSQSWGKFGGERYDANLENTNWCVATFDDSKWANAKLAPVSPARADAQSCPLNRVGKVLPAMACTPLAEGRYEIDFGTDLSGQVRLKLHGLKPKQQINIFYADRKYGTNEMNKIGPADMLVPGRSGNVRYQTFAQADEFVSAGRAEEEFRSKFNYHGFRYAIVEGLPNAPKLSDDEASLIESDLETVGSFECSNDLLNRIHQLTLWTIRCLNLGGYMVDCPHRERLGYGDGQVSVESQAFNLWSPALYQKWVGDWRIAQRPDTGDIPHTAPAWDGGGGPAWGGSLAALTWRMYELYGDRRILADNYEPMRRYVNFLESKCKDNVLRSYGGMWDFIGDWVPPGRGMDTANWPAKPAAELFNNCYRVYLWEILEKSAAVLGKTDEVARCESTLAIMRPAIHQAFYDEAKGIYVIDEQTYQVMPLMTDVVPVEKREAVFAKLKDEILNQSQGHLDTGMLGTSFLIEYLRQTGHNDLLFTIISQPTYPGWGNMLAQGATTLWEQWNGYYSHIHSCFASPGGWFYQSLAGIQSDPAAPGFKQIIIKPSLVGDLTWVKAHYDSSHGRIVSNWQRASGKLTMEVTIPANTTATVFVPAKNADAVTESGKVVSKFMRLKLIRFENGAAVYEIGSGSYQFESLLP